MLGIVSAHASSHNTNATGEFYNHHSRFWSLVVVGVSGHIKTVLNSSGFNHIIANRYTFRVADFGWFALHSQPKIGPKRDY